MGRILRGFFCIVSVLLISGCTSILGKTLKDTDDFVYGSSMDNLTKAEETIFDSFDKAAVYVISENTNHPMVGRQTGSGFIFDYDAITNKLYVMTNYHVVSNQFVAGAGSAANYIDLLTPARKKYIDERVMEPASKDILPKLCGKVVHANYEDDIFAKNVDVAIIEVVGSTADTQSCTSFEEEGNFLFSEVSEYFEALSIKERSTSSKLNLASKYFMVGFPKTNYIRDRYTFNSILKADPIKGNFFESDCRENEKGKVECLYKWDYESILFNGNSEPGASGSGIIDKNKEVVGILAYSATSATSRYVGAVTFNEVWGVLDSFCQESHYKGIKHCKQI